MTHSQPVGKVHSLPSKSLGELALSILAIARMWSVAVGRGTPLVPLVVESKYFLFTMLVGLELASIVFVICCQYKYTLQPKLAGENVLHCVHGLRCGVEQGEAIENIYTSGQYEG